MTDDARSDRTANLLIARLDALASTVGRIPHAAVERLIELATVATMRAVALELLEAERAEATWHQAHSRNPQLPEVVVEPPEQLAA